MTVPCCIGLRRSLCDAQFFARDQAEQDPPNDARPVGASPATTGPSGSFEIVSVKIIWRDGSVRSSRSPKSADRSAVRASH